MPNIYSLNKLKGSNERIFFLLYGNKAKLYYVIFQN